MDTETTVTEKRSVSGFDRVHLSDIGEMFLTQGDDESLVVAAEPDLLPRVRTEVRNGKLILKFSGGWLDKLSLGLSELSGKRIKYFLNVREIHELRITGKGDVTADAIYSDRFSPGISGMGSVDIGTLNVAKLSVDISGRDHVSLAGSTTQQKIGVSGSGEHGARELESKSTTVRISGHGNATVWATDELEATISGYGNVEYYGNPSVSQSISGLGSVNQFKKSKE